ncbi:MAG: GAF domain-containing protein [Bacteroidales bacterium]|nr:GAF domain-containing protein [Bacteroidales bacterium]
MGRTKEIESVYDNAKRWLKESGEALKAASQKVGRWLTLAWRDIQLRAAKLHAWNGSLSVGTKMVWGLVFFLTAFFIWQLMAYEMDQTVFVTVNLLMVTALAVATCWILLYTQREIEDKNNDIIELDKKIERNKYNLKRIKAELFELKDKQRKEFSADNIAERLEESIKLTKKQQYDGEMSMQWLMDALVKSFDLSGGIIYARNNSNENFKVAATYALSDDVDLKAEFNAETGYIGQVAADRKPLVLRNIPSEYLTAVSGLGRSKSLNIYLFPIERDDYVYGVAEITTFGKLPILKNWGAIAELLQKEAR